MLCVFLDDSLHTLCHIMTVRMVWLQPGVLNGAHSKRGTFLPHPAPLKCLRGDAQ